jgi:hypothetical protein
MDPEMISALKAYLKENLSIRVKAGESWEPFSNTNTYQVAVEVYLDGEVIADDFDTFSVEAN